MKQITDSFALRFLKRFCPDHLYEEIEGDLIQKFEKDVKNFGERKAKRRLIWNTIRFFRPGIVLRKQFSPGFNPFYMFNHFIKIFIRTSLKSKAYTFINVSGLAVGLACSIFTLLWMIDEFAYDQFHEGKESIYSVMVNFTFDDGIYTYANTSGRLTEGLKEFPEIEETARSVFRNRVLVHYENKSFFEEGVYADASLFKLFTFSIIEGDVNNPLPDNNSIAISEKLAKKYFNNENVLGKIIRIDNKTDVRVTAVVKDLPSQSTLQFQFVLPYHLYAKEDQYNQEWGAWTGGNVYVKLKGGTNINALDEKISRQITHEKIWPRWGDNVELFLFPLSDWHLRANFENGKQSGGRVTYLKYFVVISGFILLIACVNFMNMATARSLIRAKEIGVRKVIGALRQSLTQQFLTESLLISIISLGVALTIVHLLLPYFNLLTEKRIVVDYTNTVLLTSSVVITLLTGLVAGSYPAFFLSSLRAINILKDKMTGTSGANVRKALVVFQFSISVILIIGAFVVYKQIEYMREKDLGFDKEHVFYIRANDQLNKNFVAFKQALSTHQVINAVSRAADEPMNIQNGLEMGDDGWRGKTKNDQVIFQWLFCDDSFLKSFRFDFVEGRNFSEQFPADSANFIINEEAARRMKLTHPLGETLKVDRKGTIIGVIKNFHAKGLNQPIQPVIISMRPENSNRVFIHYEPDKLKEAMSAVEAAYKKLEPDFPMEYTFMDQSFDQQYKNEILIRKLSASFMAIALFISCLGLFGLSSFMAERRIKEIGIRKVLGATVTQLIVLLCRDFVLLVAMALVIGFPIAWWIGKQFLLNYAFRTEMNVSIFIITGFSLLVITLVTVSFQAAKAALHNPVRNLRSE